MSNRLNFNGTIKRIHYVNIYLEPNKQLSIFIDGENQDGIDWSEYDKRISDGEDFKDIAKEILREL